jgi:hypothetical protein
MRATIVNTCNPKFRQALLSTCFYAGFLLFLFFMRMGGACSFETLIDFHRTTRCYIYHLSILLVFVHFLPFFKKISCTEILLPRTRAQDFSPILFGFLINIPLPLHPCLFLDQPNRPFSGPCLLPCPVSYWFARLCVGASGYWRIILSYGRAKGN